MLKSVVAGVLASLSLMGTAYAETCPAASSIHKTASGYSAPGPDNKPLAVTVKGAAALESLKFTSARLKDNDSTASVVICRYEGDLGASTGVKIGVPVRGTGTNWKGDDCEANDPAQCSFHIK